MTITARADAMVMGLAVVAGLTVCVPVARAQQPPRPRAAVAVTIGEGVDSFMTVYVLELGAGVLRGAGFDVVPPNAASARLRAIHSDAAQCSQAPACTIELATSLHAPMLVLAHVGRDGPRYTLHLTALLVADGAVEQVSHVEVTGDENQIAEPVRTVTTALAARPPPCLVRLDVANGVELSVDVDGHTADVASRTLFLRGGTRQLALSASGRAAWRGPLQCEPAHGYRVTVR